MTSQKRNRLTLSIILAIVIVFGLGSRKFATVLPTWVSAHTGDALWTVAVFLTIAFMFPKWSSVLLGAVALVISFAVEFSQLIDYPPLNAIRNTLPGKLLLGSGFLWVDLARYSMGAILATSVDYFLYFRRRRFR